MKRVNTKTSKKIVAVIFAAVAACAVMGCSVEKNITTTETHTVTDADGNTTTTTTTNHNGEVTTETISTTADEAISLMEDEVDVEEVSAVEVYKNIPVAFTNEMGWDIKEFYIKMSSQNEWSDNFLGEDQYIDDGETANGITLTYSEEEYHMDVLVADYNGDTEEFTGIELPKEGAANLEVVFGYDEVNDAFTATVQVVE